MTGSVVPVVAAAAAMTTHNGVPVLLDLADALTILYAGATAIGVLIILLCARALRRSTEF